MTGMYKFFISPFLLICAKAAIADYNFGAVNETKSIYNTFLATDSTTVPNTWLDLGRLNIGTASSLSSGAVPCLPSTFMCTAGSITLGYNGQASYIMYLSRTPKKITDDSGNNYTITVAFPESAPVVGVYERNNSGGNTWNTIANIENGLSSPSDVNDATSALSSAQGYCGRISGCDYLIGSYIHANSGMPHVYIKLPVNLSASTISFKDVDVLSLILNIGNKGNNIVSPTTAKLYLSGTISVSKRCYIRADKSSFDFGTVYSNAANGVLNNMSATITTDCYYAPDNTQQYLKVEAVSGGALSDDSMIYQIASDSALGIVFNINNTPQCNSITDNNTFNTEYLVRTITYQQHQKATDTVNFSLCKYGVPSITGQRTVVLKLTSRWVVS